MIVCVPPPPPYLITLHIVLNQVKLTCKKIVPVGHSHSWGGLNIILNGMNHRFQQPTTMTVSSECRLIPIRIHSSRIAGSPETIGIRLHKAKPAKGFIGQVNRPPAINTWDKLDV